MKIRSGNMDLDNLFYGQSVGLTEARSFEPKRVSADETDERDPRVVTLEEQKIRELSSDLALLLRSRHAAEIKRWVDYDRKVKQWREQVLTVVGWLKKQVAARKMLENELELQKNLVRIKNLEIERLRKELGELGE
jgi:hypothetical protein